MLLETVDKDPKLGYGRWTGERLATYLAEQTGIKLSGSQVRRILKEKSIVMSGQNIAWRINRIQRKERSLEKLAKYLAIAKDKPDSMQIWEWTETGFSLQVIRRKNGEKKVRERK